jgi:hypothetical protein
LRRQGVAELDDFEATREASRAIRQRGLDDLDVWLQVFETNATARWITRSQSRISTSRAGNSCSIASSDEWPAMRPTRAPSRRGRGGKSRARR